MKVLIIIGSPRKKGNTFQVVQNIQEELYGYNNSIEFETIFLADENLSLCKGCFTCFSKGENKCPIKDGFKSIYDRMMESDGIIVAAPTYAMGAPAIMKNFIDRLSYTLHRPCFFNQTFMSVSTVGGFMGLKETLKQLSLVSSGSKKSIKVGAVKSPFRIPFVERREKRNIRRGTKKFYKSLITSSVRNPRFGDLAYFGVFKSMSYLEATKKALPADYDYYKNKESYFYTVKGFRSIIGKLFSKMMYLSLKVITKETEINIIN